MSATSSIEWTDRTWNPVRGCSIVSPGCINCYAMKQAHRFSGPGKPYEGLTKLTSRSGPQWTGKVRTVDDALLEPLSWRKPSRVFVNSMSDLFHEGVPDAFIDQVFAVMALAPRHRFQILTKRPKRMRAYLTDDRRFAVGQAIRAVDVKHADAAAIYVEVGIRLNEWAGGRPNWPLKNVDLGVSGEDQPRVDERVPELLETLAARRFVSLEPLLGDVDLNALPDTKGDPSWDASALHGVRECAFGATVSREPIAKLDWVIVGGESGPRARPLCLSWVRNIVHDCADAGVACFVKQLGARPYETTDDGHDEDWPIDRELALRDRKGGDPAEWEPYLRVREYPR